MTSAQAPSSLLASLTLACEKLTSRMRVLGSVAVPASSMRICRTSRSLRPAEAARDMGHVAREAGPWLIYVLQSKAEARRHGPQLQGRRQEPTLQGGTEPQLQPIPVAQLLLACLTRLPRPGLRGALLLNRAASSGRRCSFASLQGSIHGTCVGIKQGARQQGARPSHLRRVNAAPPPHKPQPRAAPQAVGVLGQLRAVVVDGAGVRSHRALSL